MVVRHKHVTCENDGLRKLHPMRFSTFHTSESRPMRSMFEGNTTKKIAYYGRGTGGTLCGVYFSSNASVRKL